LQTPHSVQPYGDGATQDFPEEVLVERAVSGDPAAFGWLTRRYQNSVFNALYRMTGNEELAYDLVQETFLKAYRAIATFSRTSRFYTWIYRIAVNSLRSHWRKQGKLQSIRLDGADPENFSPPDRSDDPAELAEANEMEKLVQQSILSLPTDQRTVLVLRDIEGLEYEQIAELLELSLGTVKSRIHRARMALKDKLKPVWEGSTR